MSEGLARIEAALAAVGYRIKHVRINHTAGKQQLPPYYFVDAVAVEPSAVSYPALRHWKHLEGRDVDQLVREAGV